jgi:prepilin-type N-terminal cleavage/methylation domain-containing protein
MARIGHRIPPRRAYTLLEMLIVLALLAVLAGLSWPAVRGMLGKSQLRGAAKQVRVALARTRLKAIETGVPQRFSYAAGTGGFEVGPLLTSLDEREVEPRPLRGPSRVNGPVEHFLPRDVWFAAPDVSERGTDLSALPETAGEDGEAEALVFYPNGRSSNARIQLAASGGLWIEVTLRGLTGTTKIGPLQRREQQP